MAFLRQEVKVATVEAGLPLWDGLFEQRRVKRQTELLADDFSVKKGANAAKFVKTPKASSRHPRLSCLCCGNPMRLRVLKTGAKFYGCGSWSETKCNARWTARDGWNLAGMSLEGTTAHGTERGLEAA